MGIMAYSLLWVMQDLYHQPYGSALRFGRAWSKHLRFRFPAQGLGFKGLGHWTRALARYRSDPKGMKDLFP